jgi:hypothetical protein
MAEGGKVTAAVHLGETIPSDAAQFASYRIRPAEAWQGALEVLAAFDASAVGAIREQADAIAAKAGKKDAVEMLQLLGERVVTYVRYAKPFTKEDSEQTVVFVEIRQRDAVEAALAKLRKQHSQVFAPAETGKSAGVLLYQTSLPGVGKPLTYCVTDRYLIAGLSRAAVMDYLTRSVGGSESIHRQAEFQAVMQQLPPDESRIMGQYNNPSPMVQWALTNLRAGKFDSGATPTDPMLGMVLQSLRQVSNPNVIAGLLPVNGMAVSSDPEGIRFTMFHTLRGPGQ